MAYRFCCLAETGSGTGRQLYIVMSEMGSEGQIILNFFIKEGEGMSSVIESGIPKDESANAKRLTLYRSFVTL